jgi:hypothetical protein
LEIADIEKALTASLAIVSSFCRRRLCCPVVGHLHGADLVVAGSLPAVDLSPAAIQ